MMVFTPKLALATAAVLVAIGLLRVGFVESGRSQTSMAQGFGAQAVNSQGFGATAQSHGGLIAAEPLVVSHPKDNVPALAVSGSVIAAMIMLALAFARSQTVHPAAHSEMATSRRPRLVTSGASQP